MKRILSFVVSVCIIMLSFSGCSSAREKELGQQLDVLASQINEMKNQKAIEEDTVNSAIEQKAVSAIEAGDKYYSQKNYQKAIQEYSKVDEGYIDYGDVKEKLEQVYADYIESVISSANKLAEKGDLDGAYKNISSDIEAAKKILPDTMVISQLEDTQETIFEAFKADIISQATDFIDKEQYIDAYKLTEKALKIDKNDDFQGLKDSAEEKYISSVTAIVDTYLTEENYEAALQEAKIAQANLPGNVEIKEIVSTVEDAMPVDLNKLFLVDSYKYEYKEGPFIDSFGNSYDGVHYYTDLYQVNNGKDVCSVYNLDGKYSRFNGSVVASSSTNPNWTYYVYIYVDDILMFSTTDFSKISTKVDFDIDVRGGRLLRISVGKEGSTGDFSQEIGIVNAKVKK